MNIATQSSHELDSCGGATFTAGLGAGAVFEAVEVCCASLDLQVAFGTQRETLALGAMATSTCPSLIFTSNRSVASAGSSINRPPMMS